MNVGSVDGGRPIFVQIAERIENDILSGAIAEGDPVSSTNEFAAFYRINPATAGKGVNLLVERDILHKRRGIGMFVSAGAHKRILQTRRSRFETEFLDPLIVEAAQLGISRTELAALVRGERA